MAFLSLCSSKACNLFLGFFTIDLNVLVNDCLLLVYFVLELLTYQKTKGYCWDEL